MEKIIVEDGMELQVGELRYRLFSSSFFDQCTQYMYALEDALCYLL